MADPLADLVIDPPCRGPCAEPMSAALARYANGSAVNNAMSIDRDRPIRTARRSRRWRRPARRRRQADVLAACLDSGCSWCRRRSTRSATCAMSAPETDQRMCRRDRCRSRARATHRPFGACCRRRGFEAGDHQLAARWRIQESGAENIEQGEVVGRGHSRDPRRPNDDGPLVALMVGRSRPGRPPTAARAAVGMNGAAAKLEIQR